MTDTETQTLAASSVVNGSDKNNNSTTSTVKPQRNEETTVALGDETSATSVNGDETVSNNKDDNELILVQENAFTIKIHVPGMDSFDLQVTAMELVQEIHQMLMDKEETCHRTCFSLQLDGVTLDNFSELKAIEGIKEGSIIKLVEGECFYEK
jgi:protein TIF31